jgi:YD repeat-containing protein
MWVDLDGDNNVDTGFDPDQVTEYTYGTAKGTSAGDSTIATGHLLQEITDPDSGSTTLAYNAQNQLIERNDPAGNVIEPLYDDAGAKSTAPSPPSPGDSTGMSGGSQPPMIRPAGSAPSGNTTTPSPAADRSLTKSSSPTNLGGISTRSNRITTRRWAQAGRWMTTR